MSTSLSSESLKWAHATNSIEKLKAALENDEINAIECDIMMGHGDYSLMAVPILSHPPIRQSDLTLSHFLSLVKLIGSDGRPILQKHIKLDFKEISALAPSLNQISDLHLTNPLSKTIFLNADILPGPGRRSEEHIDPSPFIETSLSHIRSDKVEVDLFVTISMFQNRFSNLCYFLLPLFRMLTKPGWWFDLLLISGIQSRFPE
jgi:hypothetical protein